LDGVEREKEVSHQIYPAEYVLPGHPDKLCDAIADRLVEEASQREKRALCGVEVAVHRASVFLTGRIACRGAEGIDVDAIVREVYASAGYDSDWYPAPEQLEIRADLCLGSLLEGEAEFRAVSDDQSIISGYAIDVPGTNYLPPEHWIAWRLMHRLACLRRQNPELRLGPDGKLLVLYDSGQNRLTGFCTALQQEIGGDEIGLNRAVRSLLRDELKCIARAIPGFEPVLPDDLVINGAGNFALGGPDGDNGLSGKKLVVDAYGPRVSIGGGALSGKDVFKADRAGAILARRIAKAVVLTGTATECRATLAVFPGDTKFRIASLTGSDGKELNPDRWSALFDLSLECVGEAYSGAPLIDCARYGHFTELTRQWEDLRFTCCNPNHLPNVCREGRLYSESDLSVIASDTPGTV
jgi:S-adenosylmethionine synthetase